MSSSASAYDPDEEEEPSDNNPIARGNFTTSSPPLQNLRLASSPEIGSPSRLPSRGRSPTKRLQSRANGLQANSKLPTGNYLKLFNEFVNERAKESKDANRYVFAPSQIGVVTWSSKEKETLFSALERKGKTEIREIASILGSKSEMEIRAYLAVLHHGLENQQLNERYSKLLILSDIPAATEISEECCQALESNALALSQQENQAEDAAGRRKHGDMWLVDRHVAALVEDRLDDERADSGEEDVGEDNLYPPSSILATSQLLNTRNWILLSERIFMNAGKARIEDNWYNLRIDGETPSLTCEAFADFYTLAVSITRRLVQSSIFFAMSRLRALERGGYQRAKAIRKEDVGAALDTLRMCHNPRQFWTSAARRHNLDVEDRRHRKGFKPIPLTYDEVEEELSLEGPISRSSRASSVAQSVAVSEDQSQPDSDAYSDNDSLASITSAHESASNVTSDGSGGDDEEPLSDPEDIHAAFIDRKASRIEELQLWRRLSLSPPPSLIPKHEDSDVEMEGSDTKAAASSRPSGTRKTKRGLIDWRDRVLYRSEWEDLGADAAVVEEEIVGNRSKRRRVG
ncbi:hypothetical protein AJ79_09728 [Helicocarpus griseus UAMH5409]|uniref:Myb-like domain-containing protein n=1 Tax=Helicocarpus griseus UAMH5409 TaxID=1447875 RepID=A0A2B7WHN1_9EURO|nr:hypothetical protein AJ79_09728 [Helicocarpus griseus UAMH5409]